MSGFRVCLEQAGRDEDVFARFVFGDAAADGERAFRVPLFPIGDRREEVWRYPGPSETGATGSVRHVSCEDYFLAACVRDDSADPRQASAAVYDELLPVIRERGYPHIVKAWNYFPGINEGEGDAERYKQFCLGRAESFERNLPTIDPIPAGTAIGTRAGEPFTVILLAARTPVSAVENPRQTSAYRYPRRYGPRSPSFSRAALVRNADATQLFISGTAAIVGHRSRHINDPAAQTDETLANLDSLLAAAAETGSLGKTPTLADDTTLRIYVRRAELAEGVRARIAPLLPAPERAILLEGAICRAELEVEIDGVISC